MSPRLIAVLLATALLAPAARAQPEASGGNADAAILALPLDLFTQKVDPADDLWRVGNDGATTYSYLPGRRPAPRLGPLFHGLGPMFGPPRPAHRVSAENTYTVVERAGRDRFQRPLPTAAFLFASAVCGIGGFAWWRCSSRGPS